MSLNGVWRVRFNEVSLIVKAGPSATESRFYEHVAPRLRPTGVPIPDLYVAFHEPERHWLVIEDISTPLPIPQANAWQPNERIIAILARLHAATRAEPPDLPGIQPHHWHPESTQAALGCLPPDQAAALTPILDRLQQEHAAFNEPWCWVSGDPNPRNWGLRDDGTPVLFDWELFAPGVPATDLAIVIPGLGNTDAYARAAGAYLAAWTGPEPLPWDAATLTRQIAAAKVATVVQLLHGHVSGGANVGDEIVSWLANAVPAWLQSIA
jgi:aminoglycoside phosphotransferase (APT) family kinase protein